MTRKAAEAAALPPNDPRIRSLWTGFLGTAARRDIERALDATSRGKCAYCENVAARDIEHFQPKSTYPARMFSWDNLLRGCKNCNNAKRDAFPLDDEGERLLIDPCADEPLDFLVWNTSTGAACLAPGSWNGARASATVEMFRLDQEPLRQERRNKALDVMFLLCRVIREEPIDPRTRERLRDHLQPHRPWLGIVRQILTQPDPSLQRLVDAATTKLPEIRAWAAEWL